MKKIYLIFVLLLGLNAPAFGQFPGTPNFFNVAAAGPVYSCGAFVAAGQYKTFMCHNLGATDTSADPHVAIQAIHGNYYQWGYNWAAANASTQGGAIDGWNTNPANNDMWVNADGSKTGNDPCPAGFRVPSIEQWRYVASGSSTENIKSYTGSWTSSETNFGAAVHFSIAANVITLTLPAAGGRRYDNGTLYRRGFVALYWSSSRDAQTGSSYYVAFSSGYAPSVAYGDDNYGYPIRCISE